MVWSRLSIALKLLVAGLASAVIMLGGAILIFQETTKQVSVLEDLAGDVESLLAMQRIGAAIDVLVEVAGNASSANLAENRVRWKAGRESLRADLALLERSVVAGEVAALVSAIDTTDASAKDLFDAVASGAADDVEALRIIVVSTAESIRGSLAEARVRQQEQVGHQLEEARAGTQRPVRVVLWSIGLALVLSALVLGLSVHRMVVRPVAYLQAVAARVVDHGDLTQTLVPRSEDELGQLTRYLGRMVEKLRELPVAFGGFVERVVDITTAIEGATSSVTKVSEGIQGRVSDASVQVAKTMSTLADVGQGTNVVRRATDSTAEANQKVTKNAEHMAKAATELHRLSTETSSLVHEASVSTRQIAATLEGIDEALSANSTSIAELDSTSRSIEDLANRCRVLATEAVDVAERGVEAAQKSSRGFEAVGSSSKRFSELLNGLLQRMSRIGEITDAINHVTDQTNLLALNASIIAAQAGESGNAFAVVAQEIRDLSRGTASASAEISELLLQTQSDVTQVVQAFGDAETDIKTGLDLSRTIFTAFDDVRDHARQTQQMVTSIASATTEQTRATKQLLQGVTNVRENTTGLRDAASSQARQTDHLSEIASASAGQGAAVERTVAALLDVTGAVSGSLEQLRATTEQLRQAHDAQHQSADGLKHLIESIEVAAGEQVRAVSALAGVTSQLINYSAALRGSLETFRF